MQNTDSDYNINKLTILLHKYFYLTFSKNYKDFNGQKHLFITARPSQEKFKY